MRAPVEQVPTLFKLHVLIRERLKLEHVILVISIQHTIICYKFI